MATEASGRFLSAELIEGSAVFWSERNRREKPGQAVLRPKPVIDQAVKFRCLESGHSMPVLLFAAVVVAGEQPRQSDIQHIIGAESGEIFCDQHDAAATEKR